MDGSAVEIFNKEEVANLGLCPSNLPFTSTTFHKDNIVIIPGRNPYNPTATEL